MKRRDLFKGLLAVAVAPLAAKFAKAEAGAEHQRITAFQEVEESDHRVRETTGQSHLKAFGVQYIPLANRECGRCWQTTDEYGYCRCGVNVQAKATPMKLEIV
jgi:hypothetical protein